MNLPVLGALDRLTTPAVGAIMALVDG